MISVIIPAYNCKNTITKTLDSVNNQTKMDLIKEVIVVNDGSTDNTLSILEDYKISHPKFPLQIITKENGGVSSARNMGIKYSTQEWIALLDSDDVWLPSKIEKQIKFIEKYKEIKFIGTGRNQEKVKMGKKVEKDLYKIGIRDLLKKYWPHTSTVLIKKDLLDEIGLFDVNRSHAEDGQLWLKIASIYPLFYIKQSLEVAGDNKLSYGISGLSANLKCMHKGCISNIYEVYSRGDISLIEKYIYELCENIKYMKRNIVIKWRKK